ncbi:Uncharacterised protein [Bacteroides thetaiotaomicron]|jgi:hypothetical protein|uniref:hypothetical protein n=1 Tax=Bacteroides thetaiotaomicron TaxID=818 RepID=UPI0006C64369|nr:hypothetical protein [Bacteroides thetaiotaomicron]CUM95187.1 Uncharacterised protein [Bacteroides thetaiotaomicron]
MEANNIIAVYNKNKQIALQEFDLFMNKTNTYMNKLAQDTNYYVGCDSKQLEKEVLSAMKEQCKGTSFLPDDIQLVSGQRFPDIIASKHFGVEVKSTKENKWVSTGSSIVESTRIEDVNHIYMLFGKLGGKPIEFKCKPYYNCLYDIAVTHSPRYLIDMEITQERTIFSKMGIEYDKFRLSEDPISTVRSYYLEKIKKEKRMAMPWWIGSETVTSPTLRLWSGRSLDQEKQNIYKAQLLILFPTEICNSNYDRATLWLCIRHSIINTHFRDLFTAGGQVQIENCCCPAIIKRILRVAPIVKQILLEESLLFDIKDNNPDLFYAKDKYAYWVLQVSKQYPQIKQLKNWLMEI